MKIVFDRKIPGLEEAILKAAPEMVLVAKEGTQINAHDVRDADALIVRTRTKCNRALLSGSKVGLIGSATIGTDHIDIPWCKSNGIKVVNAPGCNAPAVMQYVAASLHKAGFDPASQILGVVGKGNIGSMVTDLYRSAGTKVLVCDPPRAEAGHTDEDYLPLEVLLEKCDAVTFHVPYTKDGAHPTHHLLSAAHTELPNIIVNASRGPVVDSSLLFLPSRFIIDTWSFEEYPELYSEEERKKLIEAAFIATPHIAGYSIEGKRRATKAMLTALGLTDNSSGQEDQLSGSSYSLEQVIESFDPFPLSQTLKSSPSSFEALRASHLRPEPSRS